MRLAFAFIAIAFILWLAAVSPSAVAMAVLVGTLVIVTRLLLARRVPSPNLWDQSMLKSQTPATWFANLWLWWCLLGAILLGIYIKFW